MSKRRDGDDNDLNSLSEGTQQKSVSELINSSVLEKRRYYCESIIETIVFLVARRLPFRGDWNEEDKEEEGLFNDLFELLIKKDSRINECQRARGNPQPKNSLSFAEIFQMFPYLQSFI